MTRRAVGWAGLLLGLMLWVHALSGLAAAAAGQVTIGFAVVPRLSLSLIADAEGVLAAVTSCTPWVMSPGPAGEQALAGPVTARPHRVRFPVSGEQDLVWTLAPH